MRIHIEPAYDFIEPSDVELQEDNPVALLIRLMGPGITGVTLHHDPADDRDSGVTKYTVLES